LSTYNPRPLQHPQRLSWLAIVAAALLSLAFAAGASAATRYAQPGGTGDDCSKAKPCDIQKAVEQDAAGDEVILDAGVYQIGEDGLLVQRSTFVHPEVNGAVRIEATGTAPGVRVTGGGSLIEQVTISKDGKGPGLMVDSAAAADQIYSESVAAGAPCAVSSGASLRDSVCLQRGTGPAVTSAMTGRVTQVVTLTNDSVLNLGIGAEATGIRLESTNGANVTLNATNVIVSTSDSLAFDALAVSDKSDSSAAIVFNNSNYRNRDSTGRAATVTPAASGTNQTAEPSFVNRIGGDLHQLATSPTIDAGSDAIAVLGDEDLDRDARAAGLAVDIGADEFDPASPPSPTGPAAPIPGPGDPVAPSETSADHLAPSVTVTRAPKSTLVAHGRTAVSRFDFEASEPDAVFECRIDGGTFTPCGSPARFAFAARKGRGQRHTFFVHATDSSGNVGGPALRSLRVEKPKKGKSAKGH
jgi:hypothetical protein